MGCRPNPRLSFKNCSSEIHCEIEKGLEQIKNFQRNWKRFGAFQKFTAKIEKIWCIFKSSPQNLEKFSANQKLVAENKL